MANPEHLEILKQGVSVWNEWVDKQGFVIPDLRGADLHSVDLGGARLMGAKFDDADLRGAKFRDSKLPDANFNGAKLNESVFGRADLRGTDFSSQDLTGADLGRADLSGADLHDTNLSNAILFYANFTGADLSRVILDKSAILYTQFIGSKLNGANFAGAEIVSAVFSGLDLRQSKGLDSVCHMGPSFIDAHTLYRSRGQIPEAFLKGVGLDAHFISKITALFGGKTPQYYSCFISSSQKDESFARRLYDDLQKRKVHCYFAYEDMPIGAKIRPEVEEKIHLYDKVLLVISENSIESRWVENEVESALEREAKTQKNILLPVRIDDAVMETDKAWAATIRRQVNMGDFTRWKDDDAYRKALERLLRDLRAAS